ncbi:MAG: hypothetical protein [Arizlama microvirus]|nr:MAG: hypothetical protein [Arizlama microvirus]
MIKSYSYDFSFVYVCDFDDSNSSFDCEVDSGSLSREFDDVLEG